MILVVMGVAGSGKTTIGKLLADRLGWEFIEGDDFHPPENLEKMSRGIPLSDDDRAGWLQTLAWMLIQRLAEKRSAVLACSALKQRYRDLLSVGNPEVNFIFLQGEPELLRNRLHNRPGHFMKTGMLLSQFADLEVPADAFDVDVNLSPEQILRLILMHFELP
jgi:gluconokinase